MPVQAGGERETVHIDPLGPVNPILPVLGRINVFWYLFPLAAVISLVYSASRYELPERILRRAGRLFLTILIFMGILLVVLLLLSFWL